MNHNHTSQTQNQKALFEQAVTLHQSGNIGQAIQLYQTLLIHFPTNAQLLYLLGTAEFETGNTSLGLNLLEQSISLNPNNSAVHNNKGLALLALHRFEEALKSFERAIHLEPENAEAHTNKALALAKQHRFDESLQSLNCALRLNPDDAVTHNNKGLLLRQLGRFEQALESWDRATQLEPEYAEAYNNRGLALHALKQFDAALTSYDKAISIKADYSEAYNNRGLTLQYLKRPDAALDSYDKAIFISPDYAEAYANRGNALHELKRLDAAVASFNNALALRPDSAEAYCNRGIALHELRQLDAAVESYRMALAIKPDLAEAYANWGIALYDLEHFAAAVESFTKAIVIKPDLAEAYYNRGNALSRLQQPDGALASYDRAIAINPDYAEAYFNRGNTLLELLQPQSAEQSFLQALELKPDHTSARWALAFLPIPRVFSINDNLQTSRLSFDNALVELDKWFIPSRMDNAYEAVGSNQPFYLAYQECDNKELLSKYGMLCNRLMTHWQRTNGVKLDQFAKSGKIKVGIVSDKFVDHPVWNAITKGWLVHLDLTKFELHIFHLGVASDHETKLAQSRATTFTQGKASLTEWVRSILSGRIEVLVFPEIGMHQQTTQIANLRLAPLQMVTWGHPETTGLPTIDYYISSELLEPGNAERAYSEKLVKLPGLGCVCSRLSVVARRPDVEALGLCLDKPILLCPGTLFKYAPEYDWVFVEIARSLGECKFVFFAQQKSWAATLRERLRRVFQKADLDLDMYVAFIPWLKRDEFYGLMRLADVFLDPIGFSGFNTAVQALDCALPIVTREGHFMRGRLASGILRKVGLSEMVAETEDEYILLATKLVKDKGYRQRLSERMRECQDILYSDLEPVRALERFLIDVCRSSKS